MANQLRAALYLLSRDAYAKGAAAIVAIWMGLQVLTTTLGAELVTFESLLRQGLDGGVVLGTCYAAMGLAGHDLASRGRRSAILAERGRERSVTARVLALVPLVAALTALALAIATAATLLVPAIRPDGAPAGELALIVLGRMLVAWAYGAIGLLFASGERGYAATFLLAWMFTAGLCAVFFQVALILLHAYAGLPSAVVDAGCALTLHSLIESFSAGDVIRLVVQPLVYVALLWALLVWRVRRAQV